MRTTFSWHGRTYTLEKRTKGRFASWTFRLVDPATGRRAKRSLKTHDQATAIERAKALLEARSRLDAAKFTTYLAGTSARPTSAIAYAKLRQFFLECPSLTASLATRRGYCNAADAMLRAGGHDPDTCTLDAFNRDTAKAWFTAARTAIAAEPDDRRRASLATSANSRAGHVLALFSAQALDAYLDNGWTLPDLEPFRTTLTARRLDVPRPVADRPSDTVIQNTLEAWLKIEDRNLFLAIGLELAFGLRASETALADWSWFTTENGHAVCRAAVNVKNGTGRIHVTALDPFWTLTRQRALTMHWMPSATTEAPAPVLTGCHTETHDLTFRRVSAFLREHGWTLNKTNHALRALGGSLVAMKFGLLAARNWCRHSSYAVTEKHYSTFINDHATAPAILGQPVDWSRAGAAFIPQLVVNE